MSPPTVADSTKNVEPKSSQRKINKPLIEKRRRARINDCLAQLKAIVLEANESKSQRPSKLEKADILEMTVEFVKTKLNCDSDTNCRRRQTMDDQSEYLAGYSKCLGEISSFLEHQRPSSSTLEKDILDHVSEKLKSHLPQDNVQEHKYQTLSIPKMCEQQQVSKGKAEDRVDVHVREKPKLADCEQIMDSINEKPNTVTHSTPIGVLCGGQIMLLVQLPHSVTSQHTQMQHINSVSQSNNILPMIGVQTLSMTSQFQPASLTSHEQFLYSDINRNESNTQYTKPVELPHVYETNVPAKKAECGNTHVLNPVPHNSNEFKHENHWRPW